MTDRMNGLRFDVYERVNLPEHVAAIEELEEIELVPHMQALTQDEQVQLRGHLLLTGVYRSQDAANVSQLEHWIPVEISLPHDRIQSVDELAVEIDNFDVDLLTNRSLNVTGVLALRGIQSEASQEAVWREDSFTVVHQADSGQGESKLETDEGELSLSLSAKTNAKSNSKPKAKPDAKPKADAIDSEADWDEGWNPSVGAEGAIPDSGKQNNWMNMFQGASDQNVIPDLGGNEYDLQSGHVVEHEEEHESQYGAKPGQAYESETDTGAEFDSNHVHSERLNESEPELAEKQDLKIALGGKSSELAMQEQSGVGLLSQLGAKGAKREAELRTAAEAAKVEEEAKQQAIQDSPPNAGDELEWTRLFLNSGADPQSFRRVKMCIVQREETIELIADRYSIQPRELQLYNQLQEPYLSEGQVLYIP